MAKVKVPLKTQETRKHLVTLAELGDFDKKVAYGDFEIAVKISRGAPALETELPQFTHPDTGEPIDKEIARSVQDVVNALVLWSLVDDDDVVLPICFESVFNLFENFKPTYTEIQQAIESTRYGLTKETWQIMDAKNRELYLKNSKG